MNTKRHGDLSFKLVSEIEGKKVGSKSFILALGETTGHQHKIIVKDGTMDIYKNAMGELTLVIDGVAILTHEEHKPIEFKSGIWKMKNEREKDWFSLSVRQVQD